MRETEKLEDLATDRILSLAELKEDNLFCKIPRDSIDKYLLEAMDIGINEAEKIRSSYCDKDIFKICAEKKVQLKAANNELSTDLIKLRCKYVPESKEIQIYKHSLKDIAGKIAALEFSHALDYEKILEIQVVHEFFHFLEIEEIGLIDKKFQKIRVSKLFTKTKEYTVVKTRDIAAHMFCKKFLNLSYHPKLIDYLYLIATGYTSFDYLENYFNELNSMINI